MGLFLQELYTLLYERFGPQGWWPTTPPGETFPRYYPGEVRRRLSEAEQWEIVIGAVLTQNTAWRNVEQALSNLSELRLLDLRAFSALEVGELAGLIRPAGYYNQKADRLHRIARYISGRYQRLEPFLARPPDLLRRELLGLKGIGPETADSILLYAARYPFFVIDAYTRRILERLGLVQEGLKYEELQSIFETRLPGDPDLFNEYHALLVKLGTTHCRTRPQCRDCCLKGICRHARDHYPTREESP